MTLLTYQFVAAQPTENPVKTMGEDSVKTAINDLFIAMKAGDSKAFLAAMSDSAVLQTVSQDATGRTVVLTENIQEFAAYLATMKKDAADERIVFDGINIDGAMATAWVPYEFYLDGKFSHCGVDAFVLVRVAGKWKIQYIIDTRRKTGCKPLTSYSGHTSS